MTPHPSCPLVNYGCCQGTVEVYQDFIQRKIIWVYNYDREIHLPRQVHHNGNKLTVYSYTSSHHQLRWHAFRATHQLTTSLDQSWLAVVLAHLTIDYIMPPTPSQPEISLSLSQGNFLMIFYLTWRDSITKNFTNWAKARSHEVVLGRDFKKPPTFTPQRPQKTSKFTPLCAEKVNLNPIVNLKTFK